MTVPRVPAEPTPFTAQLRARAEMLSIDAAAPGERWIVRVQSSETWDAVNVSTPPAESVFALKRLALGALVPSAQVHDDFVVKLHGVEVSDEDASIAAVGATNGSIFLVAHRRRRPVR